MRRTIRLLLFAALSLSAASPAIAAPSPPSSPAIPMGGLGTGAITLRPDGSFGPVTINNNWARPIAPPPGALIAIRARAGGKTVARTLGPNAFSWPAMRDVRMASGYPVVELAGNDPDLPVSVALTAFSPIVPYNLKNSSLPAAIFSVTLTNRGAEPVDAGVTLSWENLLGHGGNRQVAWEDRQGATQRLRLSDGLAGVVFTSPQSYPDRRKSALGNYALVAAVPGGRTTQFPFWNAAQDGSDFWDSFTAAQMFEKKSPPRPGVESVVHPAAAVAGEATIPPGKSQRYDFVLAWYTPDDIQTDGSNAGHYYAGLFADAWAVASYALQYRDLLLGGTTEWRDLIARSSLPSWLQAQLLRDAGSLSAATVYTKSGYFAGIDGGGRPGALSLIDRRTAWQPFVSAIFPALDRGELTTVARLQLPSGEVARGTGVLNDGYAQGGASGFTAYSPDVACGFILQVARAYRWSGDAAFLSDIYPSVVKALTWLRSLDTDGDGIPEGGAAAPNAGTQASTAGLYLAALRAGQDLAARQKDNATVRRCEESFDLARRSAIGELWNGRYFSRAFVPITEERAPEAWWGALIGEACAQSLDLGSLYTDLMATSAARNLLAGDTVPAERAEREAARALAPLSVSSAGIRAGETAAALRAFQALRRTIPAEAQPSIIDLGSWNLLYALAGAGFDEPDGRMTVRPHPAADTDALRVPVFGTRAWFWLDYRRSHANANVALRLKMLKRADEQPFALRSLVTDTPIETGRGNLGVLVQSPRGTERGQVEVAGGRVTFTFKTPLTWEAGQEVSIDLVSPDSNQLLVDFEGNRAVSMGAPVRVEGLRRDRDQPTFRLVNPTPNRQVVNLRFKRLNVRDYDVYLNGEKAARLFDNEGRDRLAVFAPASPVSAARAARLRKVAERLQAAREAAYREGKLPLIEQRVDALQAALDAGIKADEAARSVLVSLASPGSRPRAVAARAEDAEQAVGRAEAALREAAAFGPKEIPDSASRRLLVSAVVPVETRLRVTGDVKPRGTLTANLTIANESELPLSVSVDPLLPAGWVPSATGRLQLAPGQATSVEFGIRLPEDVEQRRYRVASRTTFSVAETSWDVPASVTAGSGSIRAWSIIGPFPNTNDGGLQQVFPPEQEIVAGADYNGRRWRALRWNGDRVDLFGEFIPNTDVVGYAYTRVFSPVDQDAVLLLGSHDGVQVRLNGGKVFERHVHRDAAPGQDSVPVRLKQGWNALLLKVEQSSGEWGFYAELIDPSGGAIDGLRFDPVIGQ